MKVTNERRKSPRANADLDMRFQLAAQSGFARIRDISSSGVRCLTDRLMPLMTQVELVIVIPDGSRSREITCRGAVVRSGPVRETATRDTATRETATRETATRSTASRDAAQGGGNDRAFETAIFFTDMKDTDRVEIEQFVRTINRPAEL